MTWIIMGYVLVAFFGLSWYKIVKIRDFYLRKVKDDSKDSYDTILGDSTDTWIERGRYIFSDFWVMRRVHSILIKGQNCPLTPKVRGAYIFYVRLRYVSVIIFLAGYVPFTLFFVLRGK